MAHWRDYQQKNWQEDFRAALQAHDEKLAVEIDSQRCGRCRGTGQVEVGCAMVRPIVWTCFICNGSGYAPDPLQADPLLPQARR